jgi:uncharacterized membrane protein YkoI
MKILDAIERAQKSGEFSKLKDFFLASAFACITENEDIKNWTLLFYNKKRNVAVDCFVNDKFVTFDAEMPAMDDYKELKFDKIIPVEKAINIAKEKVNIKIVNILITLVMKESVLWKISVITIDIAATSFEIDASNGEILKEDRTSLLANV